MDTAKLLKIEITDLSYESDSVRSENNGLNNDEQDVSMDISENIDLKEELLDNSIDLKEELLDNSIDLDVTFKSLQTDEEFINENRIIGMSGKATLSSLSKIANNLESSSYSNNISTDMSSQQNSLHKPIANHSKEDSFPCDQCAKVFNSISKLKLHKLRHSNLPLLKIKKCDLSISTETSKPQRILFCPLSHNLEQNEEKEHPFSTGNLVVEQMEIPENVGEVKLDKSQKNVRKLEEKCYQCPFCSTLMSQKHKVRIHMKKKHPDENIETTIEFHKSHGTINPKENELKCNYCNKTFLKEKYLKIHVKRCKMCNINIEDVSKLENTSDRTSKLSDKEDTYDCGQCEKKFSVHKDLMEHLDLCEITLDNIG